MPLAIELAAARCRVLAPQALLERIRRQTSLLSSTNRDVPERQAREEARRSVAYTDPMTGLPNQAGFLRVLQRNLA